MAASTERCVWLVQLLSIYQVAFSSQFFIGDVLTPYLKHGSNRYSREVKECPHVSWANETFEVFHRVSNNTSIPIRPADVQVNIFADSVRDLPLLGNLTRHLRHYVVGSVALVDDPYYTLSVLEPRGKGGCAKTYFTATRSTVSSTVRNRALGCKVAVNAGYFKVTSGECLGNIVSDGRVVQTSNDEQNANFGIREDGSIVVGYIPDSEIVNSTNPFRQLVAGVLWLVRNGTNFVNESMRLECSSHEGTGRMETFANILSARTAIGHDSQGRVVIIQVNGQSYKRGINLWQFADLLISHGVLNAINLDGGGSSTFVRNGTLVSYPSDHCRGHPEFRCEREVSTVLCAHAIECLEPQCNEHGSCDLGRCTCDPPWTGESCELLDCSQTNCSNHGNCSEGGCLCGAGWMGPECNQSCHSNRYGPQCAHYCWCYGRSYCHQLSGKCLCPPGYYGYGCWKECDANYYGQDCLLNCTYPNCSGHGACSPVNGTCLCEADWTGLSCNVSLFLEHQLELVLSDEASGSDDSNLTLSDLTDSPLANDTVNHPPPHPDNLTPLHPVNLTPPHPVNLTPPHPDNLTPPQPVTPPHPVNLTPPQPVNLTPPHPVKETLEHSTMAASEDEHRSSEAVGSTSLTVICSTPVPSSVTMTVAVVFMLLTVLAHVVLCLWTHRVLYRRVISKLYSLLWQHDRTASRGRKKRRRKRKPYFVPLNNDSSSDCSL